MGWHRYGVLHRRSADHVRSSCVERGWDTVRTFTLLRLKMSKALMPSVRILRTGQPETWIRLPDPPLESDYDVKPGDPFDSPARKSFNEAERESESGFLRWR